MKDIGKPQVAETGDYVLYREQKSDREILARVGEVYRDGETFQIDSMETGSLLGMGFLNPLTKTYFWSNSNPIELSKLGTTPERGDSAVIVDDDGYAERWLVVSAHAEDGEAFGLVRISYEHAEYVRRIYRLNTGAWALDDDKADGDDPLIAFFPAEAPQPEPERMDGTFEASAELQADRLRDVHSWLHRWYVAEEMRKHVNPKGGWFGGEDDPDVVQMTIAKTMFRIETGNDPDTGEAVAERFAEFHERLHEEALEAIQD